MAPLHLGLTVPAVEPRTRASPPAGAGPSTARQRRAQRPVTGRAGAGPQGRHSTQKRKSSPRGRGRYPARWIRLVSKAGVIMTGSVGSDVVALVEQAGPLVGAALGVYGARVLDQIEDGAVEATADAASGLGRRLLRLIVGRGGKAADEVRGAVADAAAEPNDQDAAAAVRLQVKKALRDDPELQAEVRALLGTPQARDVIASVGERSVAARHISGSTVITGDVHRPQ
jgi:hypothetical protein